MISNDSDLNYFLVSTSGRDGREFVIANGEMLKFC